MTQLSFYKKRNWQKSSSLQDLINNKTMKMLWIFSPVFFSLYHANSMLLKITISYDELSTTQMFIFLKTCTTTYLVCVYVVIWIRMALIGSLFEYIEVFMEWHHLKRIKRCGLARRSVTWNGFWGFKSPSQTQSFSLSTCRSGWGSQLHPNTMSAMPATMLPAMKLH